MELLKDKILKSGEIKKGNIIKVDSFLNHQLDVQFLDQMGKEIYEHFKEKGITKILTIEASGIALAVIAAKYFGDIPVVFAKKSRSANISEDVYSSKIQSFTYKKDYTVTVSKQFLHPEDRLLILDDFLAEGNALRGLIDVANQAGGEVCGCAVGIEKGFQGGGDRIREEGVDLLSLAIIENIDKGKITFR